MTEREREGEIKPKCERQQHTQSTRDWRHSNSLEMEDEQYASKGGSAFRDDTLTMTICQPDFHAHNWKTSPHYTTDNVNLREGSILNL